VDRADRKSAKGTAFDVVLRGYDKRQVDERLRILNAELVVACNALRLAHERAAMLEEVNRSRSGSDAQLDSNFGARVEKILMLAQDEAREVRRQADEAAAAVVEQARAEAAAQRQQAEQEAAAWRADMNRGAAEQDSALQRRSAELMAQARAEANRLVTTATEQVQQRERASAHELHQLSRLHEEINADLYRAKEVLDSLFGGTRPALRATTGTGTGPSPIATSPPGTKRPRGDTQQDRRQARTV
jgi:membrane protein involved in colicin uptake